MNRRHVVLGLARPRTPWFATLTRWASNGAVPRDFVRCVSPEEIRARTASGRAFSACLLDSGAHGVDRDLVDELRAGGIATVVVDDGRGRSTSELDVDAVLDGDFGRTDLVALLEAHARALPGATGPLPLDDPSVDPTAGWSVALVGSGGTGSSVLAAAVAQHLGRHHAGGAGGVLLADLALHADQAMLHAAPDIVPGVAELVESHRSGRPDHEQVRATTFEVPERNYHLLLGLRRHRDWAALRARAVDAALDGLLRSFGLVVADVDADTEGEDECGVTEVEDRNVLARTMLQRADVVVVVGTGDLKGLHALLRTISDLSAFGVPAQRLLPVVNHAPRHPRPRAAIAQALANLSAGRTATAIAGPLFTQTHRKVEACLRDGAPLPNSLGRDLGAAVMAVHQREGTRRDTPAEPEPIGLGRLGRLATDLAAS